MQNFQLVTFVLLIALSFVRLVSSYSVSLTVEGGVSLVGPHCPGTIRLFCEGVDLTTFSWTYNSDIDIAEPYSSDESINTQETTSNPAFLSVQLIAVSQSSINPTFGNFSSILTVNLSQLEQQGIRNISCGDPLTQETIPVDIHITQETVPETPQIISTFIDNLQTVKGQLRTTIVVLITWEKLHPVS